MLATAMLLAAAPAASAETRTLKLYFTHTGERAEITYKRNGRYIESGLKKLNWFLRDWRQKEATKMNPQLMDLLWAVYQASGSRDYIYVISAYRSPETNATLRKTSNGVAKKSQHMSGNAMDFFLPDVKLSKLRAIALKMQVGGVGYYPRSGSPFVHLDVARVRHWPRMGRQELLALFPDGETMHVPADGKPLPGYNQALAAYEKRERSGSTVQVASASSSGGSGRGLLAALFGRGGGADDEEDSSDTGTATAPRQAPTRTAEPERQPETPQTILAALPERAVPVPHAAPRPDVDVGEPDEAPAPATVLAAAADDAPRVETADTIAMAGADVPVPTLRPETESATQKVATAATVADGSAGDAQDAAIDAADGDQPVVPDAIAAVIGGRNEALRAVTSYLPPTPSSRPSQSDAQFTLASYAPRSPDVTDSARDVAFESFASGSRVESRVAPKAGRPVADSPRLAMLNEDTGGDPLAVFQSVDTTSKAARPRRGQPRREPKSSVLPVKQEQTGQVLSPAPMMTTAAGTRAPSFGFDAIRAPSAVYTSGFQQGTAVANARHFSGQAVTFLSLAKFATN